MQHDKRCDRDLCHPDCPIRKWHQARLPEPERFLSTRRWRRSHRNP